jgi:hypothetical protein
MDYPEPLRDNRDENESINWSGARTLIIQRLFRYIPLRCIPYVELRQRQRPGGIPRPRDIDHVG